MTPWGRNFLPLMVLTSKNYWLIGNANLRCCSAVGMDADIGFLAVAAKRKYTPLVSNIQLFNTTICAVLVINEFRAFVIYFFALSWLMNDIVSPKWVMLRDSMSLFWVMWMLVIDAMLCLFNKAIFHDLFTRN